MKRKTAPMFKKEVFFFSFSYLSYTPVPTGFRGLDDLVDNVTNCETFCSESETLHGKKSESKTLHGKKISRWHSYRLAENGYLGKHHR